MRFAILLSLALTASAADPLVGDWKLNPQKSTFGDRAVKDGRALIESAANGPGYIQFSETVFAEGQPARFSSDMKDAAEAQDGQLDGHPIRYSTKKVGENSFEISVTDPNTGAAIRTIRVSVSAAQLTMAWSNPASKLVYDRVPDGPLLKPGASVEHTFGIAASDNYRVEVKAGDFCIGNLDQKGGTINIAAYRPDGSRIRNFGGPATGKKSFAFEANAPGIYRLALRSAQNPAQSYTIGIDKIGPISQLLPHQVKEKFTSPRIEALRKELAGGNPGAVTAFWTEAEKSGTPLAESMKDNENDLLVTFLWRAKEETRGVFIVWFPFAASQPNDYSMTRLADTDVWYRTLKIRRGARFTYQLSPNDTLTFDEEGGRLRFATAQADPLNSHRWFDNSNTTNLEYQSYAELPGAKPQPYIAKRAGVPAGKIQKHQIKSALLDNERNLSIYLPPGYQRTGPPNGLLVVFDEGSYLTLVPTPVILDNLLAEKKIAPMVAVLIANPSQETRTRELPPNPKFADFLNNELVPWVRQNYNVTSDPRQTVVAGSSFGGIASVYAGLRHPETFGNILCQSGSFWWSSHKPAPYEEPNYFAKEFLKTPKLPLKFYMDAGAFEVDLAGNGGAILEPSRHMRDVLLAKGYEVHYQEFIGGHDYLSWRGTLADGLLDLVGTAK